MRVDERLLTLSEVQESLRLGLAGLGRLAGERDLLGLRLVGILRRGLHLLQQFLLHGVLQRRQFDQNIGRDRLAAAQRRLQRAKRGSSNRVAKRETVAARHRKIANQRKDFHHKTARHLVQSYDVVVVEHLAIANMVRRAKPVGDPDNPGQFLANGARAKSGLNRRISDAGWGRFVSILRAKAEDAGRTLIEVDPRHTSDGCEICGHAARENRSTQAVFTAPTLTNTPHATSCGLDWPTTLTQREKKLAAPPVREVTRPIGE